MGGVEEGLGEVVQIADFPGKADDLVDLGARPAEFVQQAFEPQGGKFSFQGVGGKDQVLACPPHGVENSPKPGKVAQFEVNGVRKGKKGQKEKNPLAGFPVEVASFLPCPEGEKGGNPFFCQGLLDLLWVDPPLEQAIQTNLDKIDARRGVGQAGQPIFRGDSAHKKRGVFPGDGFSGWRMHDSFDVGGGRIFLRTQFLGLPSFYKA